MAENGAKARLIEKLDEEIAQVERQIEPQIAAHPMLRDRAAHLSSFPGVGPVSCAMLPALMPVRGSLSPEQAAVAPMANESGTRKGHRHITGGRRALRQVLYQAALLARTHNPQLTDFAAGLKDSGKPHKVIITAVARKLIILAKFLANAICSPNPPRPPRLPHDEYSCLTNLAKMPVSHHGMQGRI